MTAAEVSRSFFEEIWNKRNFALADRIIAPDCMTRQLTTGASPGGAVPRGPEEIKAHVAEWLAAFPDMTAHIQHQLVDGDEVFTWVVLEGTHEGAWHGVPPTRQRIAIQCAVMHRIRNGQIFEDWVLVEALGFFQALGLVEPTSVIMARRSA
ncbi:MAG TPA: ester cyclase [Thermoanaerobaculia bacterium]|nr:ester cyclase [Thermoanaerobaculia bacterium]